MRKSLCGLFGVLAAAGIAVMLSGRIQGRAYGFAGTSFVSERTALYMAEAAVPGITEEREPGMEDIRIQMVYRLARRSVVKITVKESAGCGIIWKLEDDIVIVSNKHLLMKDVTAEVTFGNSETVSADVADRKSVV